MASRRGRRCLVLAAMVAALSFVLADGTTAQTKVGEPPPPSAGGSFMDRFDRLELYSSYNMIYQDLMWDTGGVLVRFDDEAWDGTLGIRVFSDYFPMPVLDARYTWTGYETDTTVWAPGPIPGTLDDRDHDFRMGALWPVPRVGLVKMGAYDTEASTAVGLYLIPQIGRLVAKVGVECSHNRGADDDLLGFALVTLPHNDWRFSAGISSREEGYTMGGLQAGREFGSFFVGLGGYLVDGGEEGRHAYAVMMGRHAEGNEGGPSFWFVHMNNPTYRRFNMNVAVGKPGIPKMALFSPYANGIYSAMFTDQMGDVLPVPVRSYEEGRVWVRPDEWAQAGVDNRGGLSFYADYLDTDAEYVLFEVSVFYTRQRCGPLLYPHIGPVFQRERLPGIGYQDWRGGVEFGTYLGGRKPSKFYKAGRFYLGFRVLSDLDDYFLGMGEFRINL